MSGTRLKPWKWHAVEALDGLQDGLGGDAAIEGALAAGLDGRAIGNRIREGEADFDGVRPGVGQSVEDREKLIQRRISGGNERNECFLLLVPKIRKHFLEPLHTTSRILSRDGHMDEESIKL